MHVKGPSEYVPDGHSSQSPVVTLANLKPSGQDVHDTEPGPDIWPLLQLIHVVPLPVVPLGHILHTIRNEY